MLQHRILRNGGESLLLIINIRSLYLSGVTVVGAIQFYGLVVSAIGTTLFLLNEYGKWKWRCKQNRLERAGAKGKSGVMNAPAVRDHQLLEMPEETNTLTENRK